MASFIEVVVLLESSSVQHRMLRAYNVEAIQVITKPHRTVQNPEFNRCRMVVVVGSSTHDLLVECAYDELLRLIGYVKSSVARANLTPQAACEVG